MICDKIAQLRASYKIVDHRERQIGPQCLSFNLSADKYALWVILTTGTDISWLRDEGCIADLTTLSRYLILTVLAKVHGSQQRHLRKAETGSKVYCVVCGPTNCRMCKLILIQVLFLRSRSALRMIPHTDCMRRAPSRLLREIRQTLRSSMRIRVRNPSDGSATSERGSHRCDSIPASMQLGDLSPCSLHSIL
jgi:hypothetical protein